MNLPFALLLLSLTVSACSEDGGESGEIDNRNILSQKQLESDAKVIDAKAEAIARKAEDEVRVELSRSDREPTEP